MSSDNESKCNEDASTSSTRPQTNANVAARCALPIYEPSPLRLVVFISGSGRTLKNLIDLSGSDFEVVGVVSDRSCSGLTHAAQARLPYYQANSPKYHETMWRFVEEYHPEFVCLAGYLSLLPIPDRWSNRVINIHPSLIPKFCGEGMYGEKVHKSVLEAGETESGCTVHFCDNEYDQGPIILQKRLTIDPSWDHHQLAASVFELEKEAYPEAIRSLRNG